MDYEKTTSASKPLGSIFSSRKFEAFLSSSKIALQREKIVSIDVILSIKNWDLNKWLRSLVRYVNIAITIGRLE